MAARPVMSLAWESIMVDATLLPKERFWCRYGCLPPHERARNPGRETNVSDVRRGKRQHLRGHRCRRQTRGSLQKVTQIKFAKKTHCGGPSVIA
ncbi:hypothetical protein WJX75_004716 [Coccomyxa subellipsoidea]|uniref:Uncharacterized protein n=1 Tax=Coccomyxa subellipsoidea TaxID=248742 RepID=A0ABR2YBK9_9CHLO